MLSQPRALLQLARSNDADAEGEADEKATLEHPEDDVVVDGDEVARLDDGGVEVVVALFGGRGGDEGEDFGEGGDGGVGELLFEFGGEFG